VAKGVIVMQLKVCEMKFPEISGKQQ